MSPALPIPEAFSKRKDVISCPIPLSSRKEFPLMAKEKIENLSGILGLIERAGNRLPHPVTIFVVLTFIDPPFLAFPGSQHG